MKQIAFGALSAALATASPVIAQEERRNLPETEITLADVETISPALRKYTEDTVLAEVWTRPDLSARDRSIVTVAALIARNQTIEMRFYVERALDSGVAPAELSEIITHLAFYSGFPNAMSAVAVAKDIFKQRGIGLDQVPSASPELLPQSADAEAARENPNPVKRCKGANGRSG